MAKDDGLQKVLNTNIENEFIFHIYDKRVKKLLSSTKKISKKIDRERSDSTPDTLL